MCLQGLSIRKKKGYRGGLMKKMLILILGLILTVTVFTASTTSTTTWYIDLYIASDAESITGVNFLKYVGSGTGEIILSDEVAIDAEYKLMRYKVTVSGSGTGASNSAKFIVYYQKEEDTKDGIKIDEEYRYMVGSVTKAALLTQIANRTFIKYSVIYKFYTEGDSSANIEWYPGGSVAVLSSPIYDLDNYDTFISGNVITHIFEVLKDGVVLLPSGKNNGTESDTWGELKTWFSNNVTTSPITDLNNDGKDDTTGKYYREDLTIRKHVVFQPGNATTSTPPSSVLEGLKIKSRTSGSNRQRTSSITVGADDYISEVRDNSDPNPFKITEMEERGQN